MSDIAIRVEHLSKQYLIGRREQRYSTLRDTLMHSAARSAHRLRSIFRPGTSSSDGAAERVWALKDVSVDIRQGEVVGIIGRNGAGKSTLLKVLSRITEPDGGFAEIRGRVGSLLEVGSGFHPELSGRDNVYLNGAILGMRRAEIDRKFDEIVDFAEIDKFVDTPVKHYSSGMYLRLAFAVAAHLEPEILLVDEVLAVGDVAFQRKCLGKMEGVSKQGRTILFVSHQLSTIAALCPKSILLANGQLQAVGATPDVIAAYTKSAASGEGGELDPAASGDSAVRFHRIEARDRLGAPIDIAIAGQDLDLTLSFETAPGRNVPELNVALAFTTLVGEPLFICQSEIVNQTFSNLPPAGRLVCRIPRLPLPPGGYTISLWFREANRPPVKIDNAARLTVDGGDYYGTGRLPARKHRGVLVDYSWSLAAEGAPAPSTESVARISRN